MKISAINGAPIRQAVDARLGVCLKTNDIEAENWALLTLLAGRHNETRRIELLDGNIVSIKKLSVYRCEEPGIRTLQSLLESRVLSQKPQIGYIRLHNSLGDTNLIAAFDRALDSLKSTKGLILDMRDTPSGGNTTVARAIMGRFIDQTMSYQRHSVPAEERAY